MDETLRRLFNQAKKDSSLWPEYLEACKRAGRHAWRKCLAQMHYAGGSVAPAIWQEFLAKPSWRLMRAYCVFRLAAKLDSRVLSQILISANNMLYSFDDDVDNGGQIFITYDSPLHALTGTELSRMLEAESIIGTLLGFDFQQAGIPQDPDEDQDTVLYYGYTGIYDPESEIDEDMTDEDTPICKISIIHRMIKRLRVGITPERKIIAWCRNVASLGDDGALLSDDELNVLVGIFEKAHTEIKDGHLIISTNIQLDSNGVVQD